MKKLSALLLILMLTFSLTACGGKGSSSPVSDKQSGSADGGNESANTGTESGEPLALPLYNRFYLNDSELVLVKDDGSAVIDFGDGYEEESAAVQKQIDAYTKVIEEKSKELAKVMDQIKEIPLTEQLGDKAKGLQASAADLGREINKLKENLEAYVEGLKAKADK